MCGVRGKYFSSFPINPVARGSALNAIMYVADQNGVSILLFNMSIPASQGVRFEDFDVLQRGQVPTMVEQLQDVRLHPMTP